MSTTTELSDEDRLRGYWAGYLTGKTITKVVVKPSLKDGEFVMVITFDDGGGAHLCGLWDAPVDGDIINS